MFELVRTTTKDNLYLHGLLRKEDKNKFAIIHLHGFDDDFYTATFVPIIANALQDNGYSFLSVENRGTSAINALKTTNNQFINYGSRLELLKEAYLDIDAWIDFLVEKGYHNIVLQGHSLGTIKIMRYLAEGKSTKYVKRIILLSPFDEHTLINKYTDGKYHSYLLDAKNKIDHGLGEEMIPKEFDELRMSYQTYASWLTFDHFGKVFNFSDPDNNFMLLNKIKIPVKVIVGKKDNLFHPANPSNQEEAIALLKLNIKRCEASIIDEADHYFIQKEHELAKEVLSFLES